VRRKSFFAAGFESDPRGEPSSHSELWPSGEMTNAIYSGGP
jgi:hypothetical protein